MYDEDLDYGGRPLYVRRTPEERQKREEHLANLKRLLEHAHEYRPMPTAEASPTAEIPRRNPTLGPPPRIRPFVFRDYFQPIIIADFHKHPALYPSLTDAIQYSIRENKLLYSRPDYNPITDINSYFYQALLDLLLKAQDIYINEHLDFIPDALVYPTEYEIKKYNKAHGIKTPRKSRKEKI